MVDEGNQDGAREERQRSRRARPGAAKSLWKRIRVHIVRSPVTTAILARLIHAWLRLVWTTNRPVSGSDSVIDRIARGERGIGAAWHGQHLMFPCIMPGGHTGAVMVSRSADAELNARVLELAGIDTLRGSGGRANDRKAAERGGARALIASAEAKVPRVLFAVRKAYGVGAGVPNSIGLPMGVKLKFGWPSGEWGGIPIEGGVAAAYAREIAEAADPQAHQKMIEDRIVKLRSPFRSAHHFDVTDLIDPRDSRALACRFVRLAQPQLARLAQRPKRIVRP